MSPRGAGFVLCLLLRLVLAAEEEEEEDEEKGGGNEEAGPLEKYIRRFHSGTQTPTSGPRRWKSLYPPTQ